MISRIIIRQQLETILETIGQSHLTAGKSDDQNRDEIESEFIRFEDIDVDSPVEFGIMELKDLFYQKNWIHITGLISEEQVKELYILLCDWKRTM
jgi:hypothetical protein